MRDYGKVHTSFWASETLRSLDDDAKLLALYLLTCTHSNMAGAFRLPDGYVMEDLGWSAERFRKGLQTLSEADFIIYCERSKFVFVAKFLEWNKPENPNQWKSVAKLMAAIPKVCTFFDQANERVPELFRNSPVPAPVSVPVPVQEKKARAKKSDSTLAEWIDGLAGAEAIPADDPVFDWAAKVGLPREWVGLAWWSFEGRYTLGTPQQQAKRYTDWRATFRDHVTRDFLGLWKLNRDGEYFLTTAGQQAMRESRA